MVSEEVKRPSNPETRVILGHFELKTRSQRAEKGEDKAFSHNLGWVRCTWNPPYRTHEPRYSSAVGRSSILLLFLRSLGPYQGHTI